MDKFEVGASYSVLHLDDRSEVVKIAARKEMTVTLTDGRCAALLHGAGPDGSAEELFRLDECGAFAKGGVVRACHRKKSIDAAIDSMKGDANG